MHNTKVRMASIHYPQWPVKSDRVVASFHNYTIAWLMMNDASTAQMYRLAELTAANKLNRIWSKAPLRRGRVWMRLSLPQKIVRYLSVFSNDFLQTRSAKQRRDGSGSSHTYCKLIVFQPGWAINHNMVRFSRGDTHTIP